MCNYSLRFSELFDSGFTSLKPILLKKVKELFARGGTNYNAAFIEEIFGGLLVTRNARHNKKVIVMHY
jgi:hypothetical protein